MTGVTTMIICFNCNDKVKSIIDTLIKTGQYSDYAGAIQAALENLVLLHEQLDGKSHIILDNNSKETESISPFYSFASSRSFPQHEQKSFMVPEAFRSPECDTDSFLHVSEPEDNYNRGQAIAIDKWIFGQYNTLLPAKTSCRALAHLLQNTKKGIKLQDAVINITEAAAQLGDYLKHHDETQKLPREQATATGFPTTNAGSEKARLRYGRQFVGSFNQQSSLTGLLKDLKFINVVDQKDKLISLTQAGYKFAEINNPILDSQQEYPTQKFSKEEIDFFLAHIHYSVPVEDYAYSTLLRYIQSGKNTPDKLDTVLQRHVRRNTRQQVSQSFLASQRSGAISRMTDLELIERQRNGVKFTYSLTELGDQFLQLHLYANTQSSRLSNVLHSKIVG